MLNGKFYTGLPPKMIDRVSTGGRNRLESHLFWPDDTQIDTAVESRIKRRNSLQLACTEKPLYEKQNSVIDNNVETKKRFTKEFSQSSIQFYDNLNDTRGLSKRAIVRNSVGNKKMEIAEKPTNTKLELPDSIANEAYTAAKKKQAYTSKIEFYDYLNDREDKNIRRNSLQKPKMDMNDKREMELNLKNSPKLQVKRDVRSLSEEKEEKKINNREVKAVERPSFTRVYAIYDQRQQSEENYLRSRGSVEPIINVSPKRTLAKSNNSRGHRLSLSREISREPELLTYERRDPAYYETSEGKDYRRNAKDVRASNRDYENLDDEILYNCKREEAKRMLRNNTKKYYDEFNDRNYIQKYQADEEIINGIRDVYLRSQSPRKQYYMPEEYYDDERYYYGHSNQLKTPTRHGNSSQHFDYNEKEYNETDLPHKKFDDNPKRLNTDKLPANKIINQTQQAPVATPTSPSTSDAETSVSATKSQIHLRSSLCFNNGEIIGENDVARSPTSASAQYPKQRRNARSSATQRVSVGLPD